MQRLAIYLAYLAAAVVAAGLFGALHDQISYTVSHEYFTRFKFHQFHLLNTAVPERFRAAQVGFLASWWMGVPLGLLTGAAGFIQPTVRHMRRALAWSLLVVVGCTSMFALGGLVDGLWQTQTLNLSDYAGWFIPQGLEQPRRFICVGYMHNAAYLGGLVSIPSGWVFQLVYRLRLTTKAAFG